MRRPAVREPETYKLKTINVVLVLSSHLGDFMNNKCRYKKTATRESDDHWGGN